MLRSSITTLVGLCLGATLAPAQSTLFDHLSAQAPTLDSRVLSMALNADRCGRARGKAKKNVLNPPNPCDNRTIKRYIPLALSDDGEKIIKKYYKAD